VKRLLVLGAGAAQLGLLEAARKRDLYVIAIDRNPAAPGFRFADRRAILSVEDEHAIDRLATAERVDGIIAPGIDWPVAIAARVADRLGLPHPISPAAAMLATSKLRQRERFADAGVPQPRHELSRGVREAVSAADRIGYPCVVKPPDRQGQRGLAVVDGPGGLDAAVAQALEAARGDVVLVEELVAGPEVTVNGFSVHGRFTALTVTDRIIAEPPAFGVALAHVWPASTAVTAAVDAAAKAADAVGVADGPTYTQVRLGPQGARVGELAARLGGGHDAELCGVALGVDLNALALAAALGEEVADAEVTASPQVGGACVRFLIPPAGELRGVDGIEEAEAVEGVCWVRLHHPPGHRYGPLLRGADRAGAILAVGNDADDALARADDAAARLHWDTVDLEAVV
jgi:biotin carboxylase